MRSRTPQAHDRISLIRPATCSSYREVLLEQIYRFVARRANPFIIDCGANIGLSVIYFKHLYPAARIIAFEPDPQNFAALQHNVQAFALADVTLYQKAVWNAETELAFQATGSLGSRVLTAGRRDPDDTSGRNPSERLPG